METKICSNCGQEKPIEEFAYRDKKRGTRRAECKACISAKQKAKYYANKAALNKLKEEYICEKCGESRSYVLDFHHIDPNTKINTVAKLAAYSNFENTLNEVNKCICLCANCHREFHYLEKEQGLTIQQYLNL